MKRAKKTDFKKSNLKKRNIEKLPVEPLFIIAYEGECTEPFYLDSVVKKLIRDGKIAKGSVVVPPHGHTDPCGVLKDLISYDGYELYSNKWIVIDRDEVRSISSNSSGHSLENFKKAISDASKKEIRVAWSNPCFEIFIVEHFNYRDTAGDRKEIQTAALKYLKDAKILSTTATVDDLKNNKNLYSALESRKQFAINNLKKLDAIQRGKEPEVCNPGSKFYELLESLESYDKTE